MKTTQPGMWVPFFLHVPFLSTRSTIAQNRNRDWNGIDNYGRYVQVIMKETLDKPHRISLL